MMGSNHWTDGIPKWNIYLKDNLVPPAYLSTALSKDFYLSFSFTHCLARFIIKVLQECRFMMDFETNERQG